MISTETEHVVLQRVVEIEPLPNAEQFEQWVIAALAKADGGSLEQSVTIRIVDQSESAALNQQYRGKDGPTNVLSFPFTAPQDLKNDELGDLVICAATVANEAVQQSKALNDHWAHLTVHGVLHLLGYDHQTGSDASRMESLEKEILGSLTIGDPYQ